MVYSKKNLTLNNRDTTEEVEEEKRNERRRRKNRFEFVKSIEWRVIMKAYDAQCWTSKMLKIVFNTHAHTLTNIGNEYSNVTAEYL